MTAQQAVQESRRDTIVSLITFFPGQEVYELEGHSALRIQMPGIDEAVTWGMFNFNAPGFLYRFVKGETDYSVGEVPWESFLGEYVRAGRRVVEQRLDLTSVQKKKLLSLVLENLKPENRIYRYNYVKDNCATRPLKIIEQALGDSLWLPAPEIEEVKNGELRSFREFMTFYHRNYPWYQFGIDLALGSGIDNEISVPEMAFAPVVLYDEVSRARIGGPDGKPLVAETIVINNVSPDNGTLEPTSWLFHPTFVCWVVALLLGVYVYKQVRKKYRFPRLVASVFFLALGLTGLLLTFLIFVSVHEATSPNWNYLWLNPLALLPVVALWIHSTYRWLRWYFLFNEVACCVMILVWLTGTQALNQAFLPLVLLSIYFSASFLQLNPLQIQMAKKATYYNDEKQPS